jgi:hypothetical protein
MKAISIACLVEALLLGAPVTIAALYGLPWLIAGPLMQMGQNPEASIRSLAWSFGCVLALISYWRLAVATVVARRFNFGAQFWIGVVGAGFAVSEVSGWSDGLLVKVLIYCPTICAAHFSYLQSKRYSKQAS